MQFDYIIQNPPYSGSLHLTFFEKSLELLKDDGEMTIIEPATWLINVRRNGKAKIYDNIKKLVKGHVKSIKIENLNNEFQTGLYTPFSITKIDMSKTYDTIEYLCCGEHKVVNDLYDCNLIGDYSLINSILTKVQKYGDMMKNHYISRDDIKYNRWQNHVNDNTYFVKVPDIFGGTGGALCGIMATGGNIDQEVCYINTSNGDYITSYTSAVYHYYQNSISKNIHHACDRGKHLTDNPTMCVYGTKSELENWKHFVFNNKLPLFINIIMTIDQHNNSLLYIPWLVDKIYTDDEINKLFDFTEDEINLIDKTIKKFERHSLWFKRYMCGPSSVTDEDVQKDLKEKGIC